MTRAAFVSGVATLSGGFALGVPGFFTFATTSADATNTWMLRQFTQQTAAAGSANFVPYGVSVVTMFVFLFFTPLGLFSTYVVASGFVRAVAAWFDDTDAFGDPVLSGIDWSVRAALHKNTRERRQFERRQREGDERPDVLRTGKWAGIDADYVLLSSRRKPEWEKGAIVMSSEDWYRIGVPYDMETPSGLRTAYPLTRLETVEVVRRGIQYELPPLSGRPDARSG